jgi:hypothetical protein
MSVGTATSAQLTAAPYETPWNPALLPNGPYVRTPPRELRDAFRT